MMFEPTPIALLQNASALDSKSVEFDLGAIDRVELIIDYKTGVTAGAVVLEVAPFGGYTGTWATVLTATFGGTAPIAVHQQADVAARIGRLRISTALVGGVCDAYLNRALVGKGNS